MPRLDKYICDNGDYTRSSIKELIRKNRITVNGIICKDPGFKVSETDIIYVEGVPIVDEGIRVYMLNKPSGVITATEDKSDCTVMDLLKNENLKGLFPIGRLDKDTEGLLLITNDGQLSHDLLSPRKHVEKKYLVRVEHPLDIDAIKSLELGVEIGDDKPTLPAKVNVLSDEYIELIITEGRYHQVKRMLQAVGNKVIKLKRTEFGSLLLDTNLQPGEYRLLSEEERNLLRIK